MAYSFCISFSCDSCSGVYVNINFLVKSTNITFFLYIIIFLITWENTSIAYRFTWRWDLNGVDIIVYETGILHDGGVLTNAIFLV